jgi:hypothetical protein
MESIISMRQNQPRYSRTPLSTGEGIIFIRGAKAPLQRSLPGGPCPGVNMSHIVNYEKEIFKSPSG